ncbi:MAG: DegV family protein [Trueperaceae bacterium]
MLVGVVTDSTCDLPAATLRRVRVEAVPLRVEVGDETYLDWRDLDPATLYDWMTNQGVLPAVRSPQPEDFMEAYRRSFQRFESLVSIHLSERFSQTFENARSAAERLGIEENVTFIDSGQAGAGLAEIVLEAAKLARNGATAAAVKAAAERIRSDLYGVFSPTVGTWGPSSGLFDAIGKRRHRSLGHRPLVGIADGRLSQLGWQRAQHVPWALATTLHRRFGDQPILVTIANGSSDHAELARLRAAVESGGLNIAHGRMQVIGPALGARLGPGSAMVFARPAPDP